MRTGRFQETFQQQRHGGTGGQHPQRRLGLMRDHAVIDLQRKQRDRDGQHIRHERANRHLAEMAGKATELAPEPMFLFVQTSVNFAKAFNRCIATQDDAAEHGREFGHSHFAAAVFDAVVIDGQHRPVLRQHQHDLARRHQRQRREMRLGQTGGFLRLGDKTGGFHARQHSLGAIGVILSAMLGQRVQNIGNAAFDALLAGEQPDHFGAGARLVTVQGRTTGFVGHSL